MPRVTAMTKTYTFSALPKTLEDLKALPEAALSDPCATAALTAAALCRWGEDKDACHEMLNFLRGPRPLSPFEIQFLRDRLGGKTYKPFSFFAGAVPGNDYTPDVPYVISVKENDGIPFDGTYFHVLLSSGGADNPRPVTLRKKGEQWMLWEQLLLADIRVPKSEDPWA